MVAELSAMRKQCRFSSSRSLEYDLPWDRMLLAPCLMDLRGDRCLEEYGSERHIEIMEK